MHIALGALVYHRFGALRKRREHDRRLHALVRRMQEMLADAGQTQPQILRDVWHEWMEQTKRLTQNRHETTARRVAFGRSLFRRHVRLCEFDVPIAEIIPEEMI